MKEKGPPITLLKKGSLIPRMNESKADLDDLIPINYIMDWIKNKLEYSKANKSAALTMSDRVMILLSKTGSGCPSGEST